MGQPFFAQDLNMFNKQKGELTMFIEKRNGLTACSWPWPS